MWNVKKTAAGLAVKSDQILLMVPLQHDADSNASTACQSVYNA